MGLVVFLSVCGGCCCNKSLSGFNQTNFLIVLMAISQSFIWHTFHLCLMINCIPIRQQHVEEKIWQIWWFGNQCLCRQISFRHISICQYLSTALTPSYMSSAKFEKASLQDNYKPYQRGTFAFENSLKLLCLAVLCRNRRLFRCVFRSHRCLRSAVSLNFH